MTARTTGELVEQQEVLTNGAVVLRREGEVVLCEQSHGLHRFVTWRTDEFGNAFWGNYHQSRMYAERDFEKRVKGLAYARN